MNKNLLSHDILNLLARLRIMHDVLRDKKYDQIPKEEVLDDLEQSLKQLDLKFKELANTDQ